MEVFSKVNFSLNRNHGMGVITEVMMLDSFNEIRGNLNKVALAYYYCEVVNKITREWEEYLNIFEILDKYLVRLKISDQLKKERLSFLHELLTEAGFWPQDRLLKDPDVFIEKILERKINSLRVGKKILEK